MDKNFNFNQPFIAVGGLLEKEGKYLLVKEAGGPDVGKWNVPMGVLDMGERAEKGAAREVTEETGYDFSPQEILGIYAGYRPKRPSYVSKIVMVGEFGAEQGDLHHDISETKWFTKDEIMKMGVEALRSADIKDMIEDFESGVRYSLELFKFKELK